MACELIGATKQKEEGGSEGSTTSSGGVGMGRESGFSWVYYPFPPIYLN